MILLLSLREALFFRKTQQQNRLKETRAVPFADPLTGAVPGGVSSMGRCLQYASAVKGKLLDL